MLRPWEMRLSLQRDASLALHLQIAQQISEEIQRGRLLPDSALPGSRELALQLRVNRKTVVLAYEELAAQGWISSQARRGSFVASELAATAWCEEALPAGAINFSDNSSDPRLIPFTVLGRAYRRALIATARSGRLAYGDPRGEPGLRTALAAMLSMERGLNASSDKVCLVRGSQMGIFLAGRLLLRPGDGVAMETLSYPSARAAFASLGAQVLNVEQDQSGMLPDALERHCRRGGVKAVYLTPHHQFPTTVMMPAERRLQMLALAERYAFTIIEDDYDHEFHFSHRPMFPLASLGSGDRVLYIGSLSKVLAPGLRVGYLVAGQQAIARCVADITLIDRQGNAVTELAVAELLHSGELKRHIRRAVRVYQARQQLLARELERQLAGVAHFQLPDGGLALWLQLPAWLDMAALERDALAEGVRVLSGRHFHGAGETVHAVRLGFGNLDEAQLTLGVARLARAIRRQRPV